MVWRMCLESTTIKHSNDLLTFYIILGNTETFILISPHHRLDYHEATRILGFFNDIIHKAIQIDNTLLLNKCTNAHVNISHNPLSGKHE